MQRITPLPSLITPDNISSIKFIQTVPPGSPGVVTPLVYIYYNTGNNVLGFIQVAYNEWPAYYAKLSLAAAAQSLFVVASKDDNNNVVLNLGAPEPVPITDPVTIESAFDFYAFSDTVYATNAFFVTGNSQPVQIQREPTLYPSVGTASGNVGGFNIVQYDINGAVVGTPANCAPVTADIVVDPTTVRIVISRTLVVVVGDLATTGAMMLGDTTPDEKFTSIGTDGANDTTFLKKYSNGRVRVHSEDTSKIPYDVTFYKQGSALNTVTIDAQDKLCVPSDADWDTLVFEGGTPPATKGVFVVNNTGAAIEITTDTGAFPFAAGVNGNIQCTPSGFVKNTSGTSHTFRFLTSMPSSNDPDEVPNPETLANNASHVLNASLANLNYIIVT